MDDLRELYQQVIIDHGRHPRNVGPLREATQIKEGYNPLCGDRLTVYLKTEADRVIAVQFEGSGCAISMASASLMTEILKGKTCSEVEGLFNQFHAMVTGRDFTADALGKLTVLAGVVEYPMRVKCATLPWHTALAAMKQDTSHYITTEKTDE